MQDYYEILGVDRDATQETIKQVYRQLARAYHPDAVPGNEAGEARLKSINVAYETLSDPEMRRRYDRELEAEATSAGSGSRAKESEERARKDAEERERAEEARRAAESEARRKAAETERRRQQEARLRAEQVRREKVERSRRDLESQAARLLHRVVTEGGPGSFVIIEADTSKGYFAQFFGSRGGGSVRGELPSNVYLPEQHRLLPEAEVALIVRGWKRSSRATSANFYRDWRVGASGVDEEQIVREVFDALREVYGVDLRGPLDSQLNLVPASR